MSESQIQNKIIKYLESIGAYVRKVIQANKAGVPDLIVCYKGYFIGIEVKRPETKSRVSELQAYNLELIEQAEGHALVAWNVEMVQEFIEAEVDV